MSSSILLFPGQGSQSVGMGNSAYENSKGRHVFDTMDRVVAAQGVHACLSHVILHGPVEDLKRTAYAQPALFAVSLALWAVLQEKGTLIKETVVAVAGHSLGEISALCVAGVLTLEDALRFLCMRGRAMEQAVKEAPASGMLAVLGADKALFASMPCFSGGVCEVANDNGAGQVVLSGHNQALSEAATWLADQKVRTIQLPVAGAFHSSLMQSAQEKVAQALQDIPFHKPHMPVVTNVSAQPQTDPDTIKQHLITQITGQVRWRETMETLASMPQVSQTYEVGSGKVLTNLWKRTVAQVPCTPMNGI